MKALSPPQAINVYKLGTPEEQKKLRDVIEIKQRELDQKITDKDERDKLKEIYHNALHPPMKFSTTKPIV